MLAVLPIGGKAVAQVVAGNGKGTLVTLIGYRTGGICF